MGVSSRNSAPGVDVVWGAAVDAAVGADLEVSRSGMSVAVCWEVTSAFSVVAGTEAGAAVAVSSQAISREDRRAAKTMASSAKGWRVAANENLSTSDLLYDEICPVCEYGPRASPVMNAKWGRCPLREHDPCVDGHQDRDCLGMGNNNTTNGLV